MDRHYIETDYLNKLQEIMYYLKGCEKINNDELFGLINELKMLRQIGYDIAFNAQRKRGKSDENISVGAEDFAAILNKESNRTEVSHLFTIENAIKLNELIELWYLLSDIEKAPRDKDSLKSAPMTPILPMLEFDPSQAVILAEFQMMMQTFITEKEEQEKILYGRNEDKLGDLFQSTVVNKEKKQEIENAFFSKPLVRATTKFFKHEEIQKKHSKESEIKKERTPLMNHFFNELEKIVKEIMLNDTNEPDEIIFNNNQFILKHVMAAVQLAENLENWSGDDKQKIITVILQLAPELNASSKYNYLLHSLINTDTFKVDTKLLKNPYFDICSQLNIEIQRLKQNYQKASTKEDKDKTNKIFNKIIVIQEELSNALTLLEELKNEKVTLPDKLKAKIIIKCLKKALEIKTGPLKSDSYSHIMEVAGNYNITENEINKFQIPFKSPTSVNNNQIETYLDFHIITKNSNRSPRK